MLTQDTFAGWIHDALHHLYDSAFLQKHPLVEVLAPQTPGMLYQSQALRKVLLDTIESLRPPDGLPAQSPDWRAYRILKLRYVEGLDASEGMRELGLGKSQYFRERTRALEAVTSVLWSQYKPSDPVAVETDGTMADRGKVARTEVDRLRAQAHWESVDATQVLESLGPIYDRLAGAKDVAMSSRLPHRVTVLYADRVLLRQTLLNLITYALDIAAGGRLDITNFGGGHGVGIQLIATPVPGGLADLSQRRGVGIEICEALTEMMGGMLTLGMTQDGTWEAHLTWPVVQPPFLLVVDDNEGIADLFRRYLAGSTWQVIAATSAAEARDLVVTIRPKAIILDVMMPKEDGWELLLAFKASATLRTIPVIICSVLNEPHLAQTMGAVAYLPKPVTQSALLQALAPWSRAGASLEPVS